MAAIVRWSSSALCAALLFSPLLPSPMYSSSCTAALYAYCLSLSLSLFLSLSLSLSLPVWVHRGGCAGDGGGRAEVVAWPPPPPPSPISGNIVLPLAMMMRAASVLGCCAAAAEWNKVGCAIFSITICRLRRQRLRRRCSGRKRAPLSPLLFHCSHLWQLTSLSLHVNLSLSLSLFPSLCFSSFISPVNSLSLPVKVCPLSLSLWIFLPNRLSNYSVVSLPTDLLLLLPLPLLPLYSVCVIISGDSPLFSFLSLLLSVCQVSDTLLQQKMMRWSYQWVEALELRSAL